MYAELNIKSDYCGFDGEIKIVEDKVKEAGMGMPELWEPQPGQDARSTQDMWFTLVHSSGTRDGHRRL